MIPEGARATIESRASDSVITSRFRRRLRLRATSPYLAMVRRIEFDQALVDAARDAGARFVAAVAVRDITQPGAPAHSAAARAAFERHRWLVHTLLRSRRGARHFVRFCRSETTLARFARHRWAMRIVRALG